MPKNKYSELTKEELIRLAQKFESHKKYGLVWENKIEKFDKESKDALPVLREKGNKYPDIITDKNKDFNVLIEGDNYHSLSVLSYTHKNKIDVIYIDPPYNTGKKDFIYNDHYVDKEDRFRHSKWLSFMSKRLKLAKALLKIDGVIFISIDNNEFAQLKLLCDEIFGESNYIGMFSVENNPKGRKNGKFISDTNEYCLIYAKKNESAFFKKIIPKHAVDMAEDENGDFIRKSGKRVLMGENTLNNLVSNFQSQKHYSAYIKDSDLILKQEKTLRDKDNGLIKKGYKRYITFRNGQFVENTYTKEKFKELFEDESLDIREGKIYEKHFSDMMQIKSLLTNNEYEAIVDNKKILYKIDLKTTSANQQLIELLGGEYFSFPKNVSFIKHLISLHPNNSANILDFFAGSGTTGHAVLELNEEDKGNRKFILCTNNENKISENITYERIKRVSVGYKNLENKKVRGLGGNLKYLKTDFVKLEKSIDSLKHKIVDGSTEILCLREGSFDLVTDSYKKNRIKIFQSQNRYTAILFDLFYFEDFVERLKKLKDKPVSVYVFSYTKDFSKEEFGDLGIKFTLEAIPEKILETYKKIFNF